MALKYTGDGEAHLIGVPMRDLTDEDIEEVVRVEGATYPDAAAIAASGLYVATGSAPARPPFTPTVSKPAEPAASEASPATNEEVSS